MKEDEMVGWHHHLNGHEFELALGVDDGQGGLTCCGPWGRKESDTTERLISLTTVPRPTWPWETPLEEHPELHQGLERK